METLASEKKGKLIVCSSRGFIFEHLIVVSIILLPLPTTWFSDSQLKIQNQFRKLSSYRGFKKSKSVGKLPLLPMLRNALVR